LRKRVSGIQKTANSVFHLARELILAAPGKAALGQLGDYSQDAFCILEADAKGEWLMKG
jgi:hypothetical protein